MSFDQTIPLQNNFNEYLINLCVSYENIFTLNNFQLIHTPLGNAFHC